MHSWGQDCDWMANACLGAIGTGTPWWWTVMSYDKVHATLANSEYEQNTHTLQLLFLLWDKLSKVASQQLASSTWGCWLLPWPRANGKDPWSVCYWIEFDLFLPFCLPHFKDWLENIWFQGFFYASIPTLSHQSSPWAEALLAWEAKDSCYLDYLGDGLTSN